MDYLTQQNRRCEGDTVARRASFPPKGKRVVIIGGGDTGADCLGTAHRQGARSVHQFELLPRPPDDARGGQPVAAVAARSSGRLGRARRGRRAASTRSRPSAFSTTRSGRVAALQRGEGRDACARAAACASCRRPETDFEIETDLVLLAMGFTGPERGGLLDESRRRADRARQRLARRALDDERSQASSPPATCSAASRSSSGRLPTAVRAARGVDTYLMGASALPTPAPRLIATGRHFCLPLADHLQDCPPLETAREYRVRRPGACAATGS